MTSTKQQHLAQEESVRESKFEVDAIARLITHLEQVLKFEATDGDVDVELSTRCKMAKTLHYQQKQKLSERQLELDVLSWKLKILEEAQARSNG